MTVRATLLAFALTLVSFTGGRTLTAQAGGAPPLPISIEVDPPGTGGCTLAEAIASANSDTAVGACAAGSGADVIHLPAGTYTITAEDNSTHGLLTKVHGHWTIDVRTPDGTTVTHREFENALVSGEGVVSARTTLARILGREFAVERWFVYLGSGLGGTQAACSNSNTAGPIQALDATNNGTFAGFLQPACVIAEASPDEPGTLTVSVVDSQLVLTGTATASQTAQIRQVLTVMTQDFALTPTRAPISGTVLAPSDVVDVVAGQIIQVTVRISFH